MHLLHIVGARPNFMKAAPVLRACQCWPGVRQTLIHTGQHYDANMSDVFFKQLDIPTPDANLEVGSLSHAKQTAEVMCRLEGLLERYQPDVAVVYGDVNSTVAATLVCSKLLIPVAHVEAGLRSFDRTMPEEVNRIVTDHLADILFTPSEDADRNLQSEGIPAHKIHAVGNVMIDSLIRLLPRAMDVSSAGICRPYVLVTLHRPSNVDDSAVLTEIMGALHEVAEQLEVVFPVHPRTRGRIASGNLEASNIRFLEPLSYIDFLALQCRATAVITDSGGVQEETTYLGVPCLTLRNNTERPVTVTMGTNILLGQNPRKLPVEIRKILEGKVRKGCIPPLWDGRCGERISEVLVGHVRPESQRMSIPPSSLPAYAGVVVSQSER